MLTIIAELPVELIPTANDDGSHTSTPTSDANLQVLRILNLLAVGNRYDGNDADGTHDLARLEAKLDLVAMILGKLLSDTARLPASRHVYLSATTLQITPKGNDQSDLSTDDFAVGQGILATIYLHPNLPYPITLPTTVEAADKEQGIALTFDQLNAAELDELERYIFLRHRREVVGRRTNP